MEFAIETVRVLLLLFMLGIASIFDVRARKIPDVIWMIFGEMGVILYVFDWSNVSSYDILSILTTGAIALLLYLYKLTGTADILALLSMAVILPVHYEFVMIPIVVLVTAFFVAGIGIVLYNVTLNFFDLIKSKRKNNKMIFSEFTNESKHKKMFAFLMIHTKRKFERFVVPAGIFLPITKNKRLFVFSNWNKKSFDVSKLQRNHNDKSSDIVYVENILPFVVFMFGIAVFVLFPEILSMLFYYFRLLN